MYFHCANHSLDLSLQEIVREEDLMYEVFDFARSCSNFIRNSGKRRQHFKDVSSELEHTEEGNDATSSTIHSLFPTRWVVRNRCLLSIQNNWKTLMQLFAEISTDKATQREIREKANGILKKLHSMKILLGIRIAIFLFAPCESLARQLQAKSTTPCSAVSGSNILLNFLKDKRSDSTFDEIYDAVLIQAEELDIVEPIPGRQKRIPARYTNSETLNSAEGQFHTFRDKARQHFYSVLDHLVVSISDRFDQPGLSFAAEIERFILNAANGEEIVWTEKLNAYPEIQLEELKRELPLFKSVIAQGQLMKVSKSTNLHQVVEAFKNVPVTSRELIPNTQNLLRMMLTLPVTTATAERSFSGLRRLKTYLRSTMTQQRLSSIAICNFHKERLPFIAMKELCGAFVANSSGPERRFTFGNF